MVDGVRDDAAAVATVPRVVVSGSLAFDYIMTFPGAFTDHIIPDKARVLSVSFLVDSLIRRRGGVGGNIAYNLALLGERPALVGTVGSDFGDYRTVLDELGVDLRAVTAVPDELTASCFINTDLSGNQLVAFYPGALGHVRDVSVRELSQGAEYGIVGATDPAAMGRHAAEITEAGAKLIYDPSQQVVTLSAEAMLEGIEHAWGFIGNDYELAMIAKKTGLSVEQLTERVPFLVVTFGENGSEIRHAGTTVTIPPAPPEPLADPTGGGDAYRAGLLKGLLLGVDLAVVGRMASLTATFAIERQGTQEHRFTPEEYIARYNQTFPNYAGSLQPEMFRASMATASG